MGLCWGLKGVLTKWGRSMAAMIEWVQHPYDACPAEWKNYIRNILIYLILGSIAIDIQYIRIARGLHVEP